MLSWFKKKLKKDDTAPLPSQVEESLEDDSQSIEAEDPSSASPSIEEELAEDLFFEVPAITEQDTTTTVVDLPIDDGSEEIHPTTAETLEHDDKSILVSRDQEIQTPIQEGIEEPQPVKIEASISTVIETEDQEDEVESIEVEQPQAVTETEPLQVQDQEPEDLQTSLHDESDAVTDTLTQTEELLESHTEEELEEPAETTAQNIVEESEGLVDKIEDKPEIRIDDSKEKPKRKKKSLFSRLADRLSRTRENFTYQLDTLFLGRKEIDTDLLDDLEELLITADLGVSTTQEILDHARRKVKRNELDDPQSLKIAIQDKIKSFISDYQEDAALVMPDEGPFVIMVVGVNGVGKTTTIGKITHKFIRSGQSVLLVAADTFRAAAISQLKIWGERNNVPVASQNEGSDPSSVVYDAIAHAKAKKYDVVIVDTAGRLHTQANLMEELKKIKRVMAKQLEGAPHEVMLIVDATTGQNGISQAKLFNEAVNITGITLTKLDGTAKGGIVANICKELKTPIRFIGIGETIDDLRDFDTDEFIEALFQSRSDGEPE